MKWLDRLMKWGLCALWRRAVHIEVSIELGIFLLWAVLISLASCYVINILIAAWERLSQPRWCSGSALTCSNKRVVLETPSHGGAVMAFWPVIASMWWCSGSVLTCDSKHVVLETPRWFSGSVLTCDSKHVVLETPRCCSGRVQTCVSLRIVLKTWDRASSL